ncbi:MAG: ATP synthase F1 subunit delta [Candidatus Moranbacteria bacterium]|nr:ATP synthase F1 subunit delta [Candidatus Moranbacteria bacterium]
MKITPVQYAKALYESTRDKKHGEIDVIIGNFFQLLVKNNQTKFAPKIIGSFHKIWNKEGGIVEAEVITRNKIQDTITKQIEKFIKEKYKAEKVVINNKINENIKGGVIIKVGDEVMDGSISAQLANLKKQLAQ